MSKIYILELIYPRVKDVTNEYNSDTPAHFPYMGMDLHITFYTHLIVKKCVKKISTSCFFGASADCGDVL